MRPASSLATLSLALAAGMLAVGGARAQSGWVDPPARSATPTTPAETRPEPAAPAAAPSAAPQARSAPAEAEAVEPARERPARMARGTQQAERQERRMERHRRQRRLADTPPVQAAPPAAPPASPASRPEPRLTDWAGAAQGLVADYFDAVSAPNPTIVASAPRFYGEQVRFHGRTVTLRAVMAEKRDFARRWPERRYEPRGMRTFCNGALATCVVRAEVVFRAASPGRGAVSQGVAEVVMEVSLAGPRPVIVSETSRVLHRGAVSAGAAGPGRSA
ncbi:hypothetical protein [Methylobacterium radiodurans]|uniref:SnoaL-like domain-containing protein n=1 Tax=Methylobacterium radiodurans TaxID=2202828 RepID=A0A2U8VPE1_9HYPH|nr:hypothetical protein [Methylobacterium radiodurans]AWN35301.1 hypothetical protein DK427_05770 [Methylobacterium radiodurans]